MWICCYASAPVSMIRHPERTTLGFKSQMMMNLLSEARPDDPVGRRSPDMYGVEKILLIENETLPQTGYATSVAC